MGDLPRVMSLKKAVFNTLTLAHVQAHRQLILARVVLEGEKYIGHQVEL